MSDCTLTLLLTGFNPSFTHQPVVIKMLTVTFKLKRYSPRAFGEPSYIIDCSHVIHAAIFALAKFRQEHKTGQYGRMVITETEVLNV